MNRIFFAFVCVLFAISCTETKTSVFGSIQGVIMDAETGNPVDKASVTLTPGGKTIVTGSDGYYEYNDLLAKQYTVSVVKMGYQPNSKIIHVEPDITTQGDILMYYGSGNMKLDKPSIEFGLTNISVPLEISNTGQSNLEWEIAYSCEWISSITPLSGTIKPGARQSVKIKIDRSKLSNNNIQYTNIVITSNGGGSFDVPVSVNGETSSENPIAVPNGLILYYDFNYGDATDLSEQKNDGRLINNPEYITDTPNGGGKAVSLKAGDRQYLVIPKNPLAAGSANTRIYEYSMSFWIKDFSTGMIMSVSAPSLYLCCPYFYINSNSFFIELSEYNVAFGEGVNSYQNGKWHMLTYTTNNGIDKLYVDGKMFAEKANAYNNKFQIFTANPIHFGGDAGLPNYRTAMNMKLDNIRFHNRELTADEIQNIYETEKY